MSGADILAEIQAAVREVHAEVGDGTVLKCTIIRPGAPDNSTYPPTPGTPTRYEALAYQSRFTLADMQGRNIEASDVKVVAIPPFVNVADASDTTTPRNGDALEWKGKRRSVVEIMEQAPSTVQLKYEIQARAGG